MAHLELDEVNPWRIGDIWESSILGSGHPTGNETLFRHVDFDAELIKLDETAGYIKQEEFEFQLPSLDELDFGPTHLHDLLDAASFSDPEISKPYAPSSSASIRSLQGDIDDHQDDGLDDIWQLSLSNDETKPERRLLTWESFTNPAHLEPAPAFLSEAGPFAFDAVLSLRARTVKDGNRTGRALQSTPFLNCLCQLGLGRSSVLFTIDPATGRCSHAIDDARFSGCTLASSESVVRHFQRIGEDVAEMRIFEEKTYASKYAVPSVVALANVVATALNAIETHVAKHKRDVRSVLQLEFLFVPVEKLVMMLHDVVCATRDGKTNVDVVNGIFEEVKPLENMDELYGIMLSVLERVSIPWFEELDTLIGLKKTNRAATGVYSKTSETPPDISLMTQDTAKDTTILPAIIGEEERQLIVETEECLDLLRSTNPEHPLGNIGRRQPENLGLRWQFKWTDVERISSKAADFETSLRAAVEAYERGDPASAVVIEHPVADSKIDLEFQTMTWPGLNDPEDLEEAITTLDNTPISSLFNLPDELFHLISCFLSNQETNPTNVSHIPLTLVPQISLTPMLMPLHALLAQSALRSIFHDSSLTTHLSILRQFFLFGSGTFASRLSSVLFDATLRSAERRRGVFRADSGGGLGLKLGSGERREWQPTSSELMLALRGLWAEEDLRGIPQGCGYNSSPFVSALHRHRHTFILPAHTKELKSNRLPSGLSFALRTNLTVEEIDRILDADSIYALDFLRLSFTSPEALASIITPASLEMYDRVFRHLLRMLRMQFVIGQLWRDMFKTENDVLLGQRFRHDATHFINTIMTYTTYTAIDQPWAALQAHITALEEHVALTDSHSKPTTVQHTTTSAEHLLGSPNSPHTHKPQTIASNMSLAGLASAHSTALKTMTSALLLRKRHSKAADALEAACNTILKFAKLVTAFSKSKSQQPNDARPGAGASSISEGNPVSGNHIIAMASEPVSTTPSSPDTVQVLYADFKRHKAAFSEACAAIDEKRAFSSRSRTESVSIDEVEARKMREDLITRLSEAKG